MQAMLAGELPYPHIMQTLDYSLLEVDKGRAVFQGVPQLMHYNPLGSVHGGWYATLLDSALGCAVHTALEAGQGYTTAELGIHIVRAASHQERPAARHRQRGACRPAAGHGRGTHRRRRRQAVCTRQHHLPGVPGASALRRYSGRPSRGPRRCRRWPPSTAITPTSTTTRRARAACAEALRARIAERFSVQLGRWHDVPVGPHTAAMYQVAFDTDVFAAFVPWLMLNRNGLDVLVHPNTLAPRDDHLQHALWLGDKRGAEGSGAAAAHRRRPGVAGRAQHHAPPGTLNAACDDLRSCRATAGPRHADGVVLCLRRRQAAAAARPRARCSRNRCRASRHCAQPPLPGPPGRPGLLGAAPARGARRLAGHRAARGDAAVPRRADGPGQPRCAGAGMGPRAPLLRRLRHAHRTAGDASARASARPVATAPIRG